MRQPSGRISGRSFDTTGSSMSNRRSADPSTCSTTSRATRTAWRSRIIAWSTWPTITSRFAGRTTHTAARQKLMTVSAIEFLRRFSLHVLPRGFVRIRFFGFLASRRRADDLPRCRRALDVTPPQPVTTPTDATITPAASWPCPRCGGMMIVVERLAASQVAGRALAEGIQLDTS